MSSMEGLAPAAPPQAADRLRWLDLLPVIAFTVLGIILVFAVLVGLARANRGFYRANLGTISLSAALRLPRLRLRDRRGAPATARPPGVARASLADAARPR